MNELESRHREQAQMCRDHVELLGDAQAAVSNGDNGT
jgi:hypothetical protein